MIYLAGPMGRTVGHDNSDAFMRAAQELMLAGYSVSNPATLQMADDYEGVCVGVRAVAYLHIEGVALIDGWEKSAGARTEAAVAIGLGKPARLVRDWVRDSK